MRAGVTDAVFRIVRRFVFGIRVAAKTERHNFHPRITGFAHESSHSVVDNAEIFGNDFRLREILEKPELRSVLPLSVFSRLFARFDAIISVETPEMVESDYIVNGKTIIQPVFPPIIAVLLHFFPVVNGIAPKLPVLRERVGRNAGNFGRRSVVVKRKQFFAVFPHFHAVPREINRNIPENFHAVFVGVGFKRAPLLFAKVLREQKKLVIIAITPDKCRYKPIIERFIFSPFRAVAIGKSLLERHKHGIIGILSARNESPPFVAVLIETAIRLSENFRFFRKQRAVIYPARIAPEIRRRNFLRRQQTLLSERLQVYIIMTKRLGRARRIRTVAVRKRQERQNLPYFHSGGSQIIDKFIRVFAECSYSLFRRKRSERQQYSAFSCFLHIYSFRDSARHSRRSPVLPLLIVAFY